MNIAYSKFYALVAIVVLSIDRLTKYAVMYRLPHYKIHQYASIDLVFNRGISFGMFHSDNTVIFAAVNILIAAVIVMLMVHAYERLLHGKLIIGEMFIFAGAISNLVDRWLYNGVVDFIALSYGNWHFAVFNVADVFICCGVLLMLILECNESWQRS
jgi:signal peptidase II